MNVTVLAVGKLKERYLTDGCREYEKRLGAFCKLNLVELPEHRLPDVYKRQEIEYGIMIETPAAVMATDLLAREGDFFSIGTNDLTQYTLACDRMNASLSELYDPRNLSVLRMIALTVRNAHKAGIWAGICGESAGDLELTGLYLKLGVDELSVSPASVLEVRNKVLHTDSREVDDSMLNLYTV